MRPSTTFDDSPLICRRATSLTIVRCLSLILLTFPITLFLPAKLNFPQPFFGMYFLAAAHLLTLVAFWLPRVRENAPLAGDLGFAVVLDESAK